MIAFVDLVPVATEKVSLIRPVEYCLVEEYSEGTIHKGEPEPRNGNVNTVYFVYFINQARGNTRISRTEFTYDEACDCKWLLIFELPASNSVRKKYTFTN